MPAFHSPTLYIDAFTYWPSQMDQFFSNFVQLFAEGSFYLLFAFLFGYGAMIIADRSAAKGIYFPTFFERRLAILLVIGLILGFGMKFTLFLFLENFIFMAFQMQFNGAFTALFYLTSIVLFVQTIVGHKMLQPFANVGRFSMSNYLLQSIAMTTLFYSYGFGIFGSMSYTTGFAIVLGFFTLQILLSKWWAPRFRYGPVEYIWRWGTYGKKPTFKKYISKLDLKTPANIDSRIN